MLPIRSLMSSLVAELPIRRREGWQTPRVSICPYRDLKGKKTMLSDQIKIPAQRPRNFWRDNLFQFLPTGKRQGQVVGEEDRVGDFWN